MKILMVTPMLPHPLRRNGASAGDVHAQLAGLNAHHEITLARFAGPDPGEAAKVWLRWPGGKVTPSASCRHSLRH
jgi:hypothetical protein